MTEEAFCIEFLDKRLMHLEQGTQDYFNHNLFCSFFQCYSMLLERIQSFARISVLKDKTYCFLRCKPRKGGDACGGEIV